MSLGFISPGGTSCVTEVLDNFVVKLAARMALVALVIGTAVTVAAAGRVTIPLLITGVLGWSFVPVLQLLTGLLLVRNGSGPRLRQLERYFATHWPWSIWILAFHAALLLVPPAYAGVWLTTTAMAPILWTVMLLLEFCRRELMLDRRTAVRRVALHQAVTYLLVLGYVSIAVALWPRILGLVS